MLGVCLLFVGIVLINNGMCALYKVDGKSAAVMNILTGTLSLFINFVNLVNGDYYAAGTGLLFCFTYLFVAFSRLLNLSPVGHPLGNLFCGGHPGEKAWTLCAAAADLRGRGDGLDSGRYDAAAGMVMPVRGVPGGVLSPVTSAPENGERQSRRRILCCANRFMGN